MNQNNSMPRRDLTRREFIAETALASAALVTLPSLVDAQPKSNSLSPTGRKRRYVIVGLGARYGMFRDAILKTYAEHNELVGLCDINEGRLRLAQSKAREIAGVEIPGYHASEFERMIRETR
ncbi:MAG: twin-arginine translocation signal domain-containing protein, partial [Verrucomicrobiae bacterium]|nr:twin-arginine translocation signal domain-containing protein [Verrucomicrobiae bacterium]